MKAQEGNESKKRCHLISLLTSFFSCLLFSCLFLPLLCPVLTFLLSSVSSHLFLPHLSSPLSTSLFFLSFCFCYCLIFNHSLSSYILFLFSCSSLQLQFLGLKWIFSLTAMEPTSLLDISAILSHFVTEQPLYNSYSHSCQSFM